MNELRPIHPALDVVGDTLYVAVRTGGEDGKPHDVVLTSEREQFTQEQWEKEAPSRGLAPLPPFPKLDRSKPRWDPEGIAELVAGELRAPDWQSTYSGIYRALDERLVLPRHGYLGVLTLWSMATYFHPLFECFPFLHLLGPGGSGKSRVGDMLQGVAFNAITEGSATRAVQFRLAHDGRYTQVLRECDHLHKLTSGDQVVQDLQAGYKKSEGYVDLMEVTKDAMRQTTFYTYSPRAFLSTKGFSLAPTLRRRCIRLDLVKSANPDKRKLRRSHEDAVWAPLRDEVYRLLLCDWQQVAQTQQELKDTWDDIQEEVFDNWLPLLTMAKMVSPKLLEQVKEMAKQDEEEHQQDASESFHGALYSFAWWLVTTKDGRVPLSGDNLYGYWLSPTGHPYRTTEEIERQYEQKPTKWAKETGTTVTLSQLRQWVKGPDKLLMEMKKLDILDGRDYPAGDKEHTRSGNVWHLREEHIKGVAAAYLGEPEQPLATTGTDGRSPVLAGESPF